MSNVSPAIYYAFPDPAPEEHLLSALLRYARFSPASNYRNAIKTISRDTCQMGAGRPYRKVYGDICALFDPYNPGHRLLDQHSLFRYFQPFEPFPNALKDHAPRMPGGIRLQTQWRWCVACADEDLEKYGFHYLHTEHQLPGNCLCERHQVPLTFECSDCKATWLDLADFANDFRLPTRCRRCTGKLSGQDLLNNPTVHWIRQISFELLDGRMKIPSMGRLRSAYRQFIGLDQRPAQLTVATRKILAEANRYVRNHIDRDAAHYFFRCFTGKENHQNSLAVLPLMDAAYDETAFLHPIVHLFLIRTIFGHIENIPIVEEYCDDVTTLSAPLTVCTRA